MKLEVYRIQALDKELEQMLEEADQRCAVDFALMLDDMRVGLSGPLEAISRSTTRIQFRNADLDADRRPKRDGQGRLTFSTLEQQEAVSAELAELVRTEYDIDDSLANRITKQSLVDNGLHTSGRRIANLRPILNTSVAEPAARPSERTVLITPRPGLPNA